MGLTSNATEGHELLGGSLWGEAGRSGSVGAGDPERRRSVFTRSKLSKGSSTSPWISFLAPRWLLSSTQFSISSTKILAGASSRRHHSRRYVCKCSMSFGSILPLRAASSVRLARCFPPFINRKCLLRLGSYSSFRMARRIVLVYTNCSRIERFEKSSLFDSGSSGTGLADRRRSSSWSSTSSSSSSRTSGTELSNCPS